MFGVWILSSLILWMNICHTGRKPIDEISLFHGVKKESDVFGDGNFDYSSETVSLIRSVQVPYGWNQNVKYDKLDDTRPKLVQVFLSPLTISSIANIVVWFCTSLGFGGFSIFLPQVLFLFC